jgi:hypothetical protein
VQHERNSPKVNVLFRNVHREGLWAFHFPLRPCKWDKSPGNSTDMALPYSAGKWIRGLHYAAGLGSTAFSSSRSSLVERRSSASMDRAGYSWGVDFLSVACTIPRFNPLWLLLWGYVKDKVFVPPQPANIHDLKNIINADVETITPNMLFRVPQELDSRLHVCRVTKDPHIEYF